MAVNQVKRNGSYAPLSAHYYKDDAILEAGPDAEILFTRGLAFCAETLSDGLITDRQLAVIGFGLTKPSPLQRADALVQSGAWERIDKGYRVRSWTKWNLSADEIRDKQRRDSERKHARHPNGNQGASNGTP